MFRPLEADSPLLIDPDTPLPATPSLELFEAIAWKPAQILKAGRCVKNADSLAGLIRETPKSSNIIALRKARRAPVAVTEDHANTTSNLDA